MNQKNYNNNVEAFLELVRAGLWDKEARLLSIGEVNYDEVMRLAEEQSVVGLVTAGLEHVTDVRVPQEKLLQFIGETLQLEQQNSAMNKFVAMQVENMRKVGVYTLLLKGQGIAQCYQKPLWRACGDVDFFLSEDNYEKAKRYLLPKASSVEKEYVSEQHLGMVIEGYSLELHGSLQSGLSSRVDNMLGEIKRAAFNEGKVRSWMNGRTQVFLLNADEDAIYVFTHILQHFYRGGIGLRQICDWCRLLWAYRTKLNHRLLESRLKRAGLMTEWKTFGAMAVEYLGMPSEAMPFYDSSFTKRGKRVMKFVMEVGNFGHNRDNSYFERYPYIIRKTVSLGRRVGDIYRHARIFPLDSFRFFPSIVFNGVRSAIRGE